jgi:hypothetical protein
MKNAKDKCMKSKTQKMKLLNKKQIEFNDFVLNKVTPLFDVRGYKFDLINPPLLQEEWKGNNILVTIPYGDRHEPYLARIISECYSNPSKFIVVVLGAKINTNFFHRLIFPYVEEIGFVLKGKRPCCFCIFAHGLTKVAFKNNDVDNIFTTISTSKQDWKYQPGQMIDECEDDMFILKDSSEDN